MCIGSFRVVVITVCIARICNVDLLEPFLIIHGNVLYIMRDCAVKKASSKKEGLYLLSLFRVNPHNGNCPFESNQP